jgi:hypothetical protein
MPSSAMIWRKSLLSYALSAITQCPRTFEQRRGSNDVMSLPAC